MTVDEFELRLVELLHGPTFELQRPEVQAEIKKMLGVDPDSELEKIEPPNINRPLVTAVADYLINEEELGGEEETEDELIIRMGLFIYGFVESRGLVEPG